MKWIRFCLYGLLPIVILVPLALLLWGLEERAGVVVDQQMDYAHVSRLHALMKSHDPRRLRAGESKALVLAQDDINLGLQYLTRSLSDAGARLELQHHRALAAASFGLHRLGLERYLNLSATLVATDREIRFESARLGTIPIPNLFSNAVLQLVHRLLWQREEYRELLASIKEWRISDQELALIYEWRPQAVKEALVAYRDYFSTAEETEQAKHYRRLIAEVSRELRFIAPLQQLLIPLFESAAERSTDGQQAVLENQALLSALGLYMAGETAQRLLGARDVPVRERPARRYLTLSGRHDLAQHFVLSAYLASAAGDGVADGLGLFKEFKDSQGGSGFSFADLAADTAGRRFAQLALDPATAPQVQLVMRNLRSEQQFIPATELLPEGLQEIEFRARYRSIESQEYQQLMAEIEKRLQLCELYRL